MPELSAFPASFEDAAGRDVAALHDPRPLVIVGARGADGAVGLATVIWATPLSHTPPLVAFALRERSHTLGLLRASGAFSLATLPADAASGRLAELCGNHTGHRLAKGDAVDYVLVEARAEEGAPNGDAAPLVPVPAYALSWEACAVRSVQEAGDHLLVIGEVLRAATRASRDDRGRVAPVETLLCIQHGAYAPAAATLDLTEN